MNNALMLQFDIQSEWHIGSGDEGGAYADALVLKDHQGLPYIPGKSVKGLLREAMQTAGDNGWFSPYNVKLLFGYEGEGESTQGKMVVSSATLPAGEQAYFVQFPHAKKHLFRTSSSTAIDHQSGVAKEGSLRGIETTIPMILTANIHFNGVEQDVIKAFKSVLPLVTHLGIKRHRGLGVVFVTAMQTGR